ncbi:hypothetical protein M3J09_004122 [Ascochyta lentis]
MLWRTVPATVKTASRSNLEEGDRGTGTERWLTPRSRCEKATVSSRPNEISGGLCISRLYRCINSTRESISVIACPSGRDCWTAVGMRAQFQALRWTRVVRREVVLTSRLGTQ